MRKPIGVVVGMSLLLLTAFALSGLPARSQQDVDSRLRGLGLPEHAELGVVAMDSEGVFWDVTYFDRSGQEHVLIHRERPKPNPPAP